MFSSRLFAIVMVCVSLLAPAAAQSAGRGPSTMEERKQALEYIQAFETNPLGKDEITKREWVLRWIIEVPDLHVSMCIILDKLPKGNKKDASSLLIAQTFSQAAFVIQNPERQGDLLAQYQAGVEGLLRTYQNLLKSNPKDKDAYLDDLVQRREAGMLDQYVKERAATSCNN